MPPERGPVALTLAAPAPQGTGFPLAERDRLGLRGLVPPREMQLQDQAKKAREGCLLG